MPPGTPGIVMLVRGPTVNCATSTRVAADPASITYPVAPTTAAHDSVTVPGPTSARVHAGRAGMAAPEPTVNEMSFDGALSPQALAARTRTKYVPAGASASKGAGAV